MLAMGIAHRKGERSQALKWRNTIPFGIILWFGLQAVIFHMRNCCTGSQRQALGIGTNHPWNSRSSPGPLPAPSRRVSPPGKKRPAVCRTAFCGTKGIEEYIGSPEYPPELVLGSLFRGGG